MSPHDAALRAWLSRFPRAVIAFSGGLDSAFLAAIALEVCGAARVQGVFVKHEAIPTEAVEDARALATELGLPFAAVEVSLLGQREFGNNGPQRCGVCKSAMFAELRPFLGDGAVAVDGTLKEELEAGLRPGLRAAAAFGVLHPLAETGWTKERVRAAARSRGYSFWNAPSSTCLATRFPNHALLTSEALGAVGALERLARSHGLLGVRARVEGVRIRLEVAEGHERAIEARASLIQAACKLGFHGISLDLLTYGAVACPEERG